MLRLVSAILLVSLAAPGCTALLDPGEVQCTTTADCTARGSKFAGAVCMANVCQEAPPPVDPLWGCLGNVPVPNPDPTKFITITEQLVLAADHSPVTDVTCDVCDKLDIDCTGTNPNFPKGLTPDANGNVTASVQQGFDGFVRVTGPTTLDSRIFIGQPIITPPSVKLIQLLRPMDYSVIAAVSNEMVDMTRGTAILEGVDCQGLPQPGITFQTQNGDASTVTFYLVGMLPELPPTATSTDSDGFGGFFNMPVANPPVSSAVAKAYRAAGNVYIGESSFDVLAYTISYVLVSPSPS